MNQNEAWPRCEACDNEMARFGKVCPDCLTLLKEIHVLNLMPQDERVKREMEAQGWKEVRRYEFKKRTSLIFANEAGEQIAVDILKEDKWPKLSRLIGTRSTRTRS